MNTLFRFTGADTDLSSAIAGTYDPVLVALSFLVAAMASYASILISDRIRSSASPAWKRTWHSAGALAMGSGIWTMHFVGMLALSMPMVVHYDLTLTLISTLPAVAASWVALRFMSLEKLSFQELQLGGLALGSGVAAMHYTGMSAMVMSAVLVYSPVPLLASATVTQVLASGALFLRGLSRLGRVHAQIASAVAMGLAIASMHYSAMGATYYLPATTSDHSGIALDPTTMATIVTLLAGLLISTAITCALADARLEGVTAELRASERRNRLIVESAGEGIFAIAANGTISSVNRAGASHFGYSESELLDNPFDALVPQVSLVSLERSEMSVHSSQRLQPRGVVSEEQGRKKNGSLFPILLTQTAYELQGERTTVAIVLDLSEKKRMESKLLQSQKLESIGELAAGIAHEINTPAQYVGDNLEFARDSLHALRRAFASLDELVSAFRAGDAAAIEKAFAQLEEVREAEELDYLLDEVPVALTQSVEGMDRIVHIVRAMKEFSHPGQRERKCVDVNQALRSTIAISANAWRYVAEIETDFGAGLESVPCYAAEMNQVYLNLLVNAVHAIEQTAAPDSPRKGLIRIATRSEDGLARIDIADSGCGIPEAIRARLFDPFFTTKEVGKGTGQGLAIARSVVVDMHGGTLDLESEEGQGSVFTVRLPLSETIEAALFHGERATRSA